ncbi:hypothetical protein KAJ61_00520, partial [Candidatus Parcubacteria bacterium]|nr:hypothetical protein [Candidatus Parcubacteria bacterium]
MKKLFQFSKIIRGLSSGSKFLLGSVFISSFAFIYFAVAAPPTSPYAPGETLAPICSPGDANCTVVTPAVSGDNADITSLSTLTFIDINGGTIDGAVIGVSDPAAAVFTNLQSGQDGSDGQFTIYSEQGAADYSIIFQPNASMTQSTTYVLPPDDGSVNEFLMTNGSGELIWQNVSVVGGNTLDQAYDEGGAGIGRTLAVDSGAIRFFGSNAADETLEITNSGNGGALFIENIGSGLSLRVDDEASDTSPFVIDAAGNVGIGTDSPGNKLEIVNTSAATETIPLAIKNKDSTDGTITTLGFSSFSDGTITGKIQHENLAASQYALKFGLWTGLAVNPLMTIINNGNIGIGTTDPGTLLQLEKDGDAYLTLKNATDENTDGGAETRIIFEDHENAALAQIQGSHDGTGVDTKGDLIFSTHSGSALAEAMRIDSSGNVGIGTDAPGAKLEVSEIIAPGSDNFMLKLYNPTHATDSRSGLLFEAGTSAASAYIQSKTDGAGDMDIDIDGSILIKATGNIGIGTVSPGTLLQL